MRARSVVVAWLLAVCLTVEGWAQAPKVPEAVQKAGEVLTALADIDMLLVLTPLKLSKEQIGRVKPLLEQAQAELMRMEERNAQALLQLREEVLAARNDALRGKTPSEDFRKKLREADSAASQLRLKTVDQVVRNLWARLDAILSSEQKTTIQNWSREQMRAARRPEVDKVSRQELGEFFTREVLLAPRTLPLLEELQKVAE
ncbi:MAG: hypothetical protein RMM06_02715 [Armatimonadota bacterium]|nr:hypothetical protein [Armatimonadota bacterium]MDW8289611.1 hypothetical protein [Armatimonadota bacterium]